MEESIRCLNLLKRNNASTNLSNRITYVGVKKYKTVTQIRAFEYFALSRRMREKYELPSITTLTRFTSKVKT